MYKSFGLKESNFVATRLWPSSPRSTLYSIWLSAIAPEVIAIGRKLQKALKDYRNAVIQDNQIKQERFGSADNIPF